MATIFNPSLPSQHTTDAEFRTWTKFIHDTFALGWTDTHAAGEIDFTTVLKPAAANTVQGFKVYAMADALQATAPVFVKIEFGSRTTVTSAPGIWLTVGTTHDGAGTLGNIMVPRVAFLGSGTATAQTNNYGSADTNRVTLAMFLTTAAAYFWISIERTKNNSGVDTNVGVMVAYAWNNTLVIRSHYCPFSGTVPNLQTGLHIVLAQTTPSVLNGNVGVSPVIFMGYDAKQPGTNLAVCLTGDFADYASLPIVMYGVSHTYQHCGPNPSSLRAGAVGASGDTNTRLLIRYE